MATLPFKTYDPKDLMVPEVSVADRDAVWKLWWAPIGESQKKLGGFWSNVLPSSVNNYSPFEREFLAFYWALVKTEHLTMSHQVTMRLNCPSCDEYDLTHQVIM